MKTTMSSKPKILKKGFTTGAAAAAAVKAALLSIVDKASETVEITFLTGERKDIQINFLKKHTLESSEAIVIKDAGDDPDITHKAEIGALVTLCDAGKTIIKISGGDGVGTITKPGLEQPVGEAAINSGPRKMIRNCVKEVFDRFNIKNKLVEVKVFVPKGKELAKKTLNTRLGIIGGISILGTTGIVTPLSHDAYIATIKSSVFVAAARKLDTLVFTTGRRSERFAMEKFQDKQEEAFIQTGDFFKASLDMVLKRAQIKSVIYTVFFGKAVKMALGFEHTHAAKSSMSLEKLGIWAERTGGSRELQHWIATANTARHAFEYIYPRHPALMRLIGEKIKINAECFSEKRLNIRVIIFDFNGETAFDSLKEL